MIGYVKIKIVKQSIKLIWLNMNYAFVKNVGKKMK